MLAKNKWDFFTNPTDCKRSIEYFSWARENNVDASFREKLAKLQ